MFVTEHYNLIFRKMDELYNQMNFASDFKKIAVGCIKPCNYQEYKIIGDKAPTSLTKEDFLTFALVAVDNNIYVETEALLYPGTSLVAEIGGTLGLFIGFSFMILWDGIVRILHLIKEIIGRIYIKCK